MQCVDGAVITKPRSISSGSTVTKSSSALPSVTKNDEVVHRDNKLKKSGSSSNNIMDPKKRLMVEDTKGKVRGQGIMRVGEWERRGRENEIEREGGEGERGREGGRGSMKETD